MDVARMMVRTKYYNVFNMVVHAKINGSLFHIKVLEEWCGPMHWNGLTQPDQKYSDGESRDSDDGSDDDDRPPLFTTEDSGQGEFDEEEEEDKGADGSKAITLFKGKCVEKCEAAIHEVGKETLENREDECSFNNVAHIEHALYVENKKSIMRSLEGVGPSEVKGPSC